MPERANDYGPTLGPLVAGRLMDDLGPGRPNEEARAKLTALTAESAFAGRAIADRDMANACIAAVLLLHNLHDESHAISQRVETPTGSYWHGILHRREPDYANAKYWFRRVGAHPVFASLRASAGEIARGSGAGDRTDFLTTQAVWDPFAFVDLCEDAASGSAGNDAVALCGAIQQREWELLFDWTYRRAIGAGA